MQEWIRRGCVGQVVNLRRVGNPPGRPRAMVGRPIDNRPQVDNLPHNGVASAL
jgi:hypothetical protein